MMSIKVSRVGIAGVDAYSQGGLVDEPLGLAAQQLRCNPLASMGLNDIDPFQFTIAAIPLREMTGDQSNHTTVFHCHISSPRLQRFLRMNFTAKICQDAFL